MSGRNLGKYLEDLTTVEGGSCLHLRESSRAMWRYRLEQFAPETFHSVIADVESLDEEEVSLISKILKPGGHLCLMSDDSAVAIAEDLGFEIRDTIYLANSAAEIFYCSKASKKEKNQGLDSFTPKTVNDGRTAPHDTPFQRADSLRKNTHPTVKPLRLLDWLLEEFSSDAPQFTVLDPFMGSGSAGVSTKKKGFQYIGIEIEEEYVEIAKARLETVTGRTPILHIGDCVEVMKELPSDSIDLVLCDPPYGLKFMAKGWDNLGTGAQQEAWHIRWLEEAYRVLKSGGAVVAFGGTRTFHRLNRAMSAVGLNYEPLRAWVYGSGFPKSHNLSLSIDKSLGREAERAVVRTYQAHGTSRQVEGEGGHRGKGRISGDESFRDTTIKYTKAASAEAEQWEGWGSALKPAWEAICVGRKP